MTVWAVNPTRDDVSSAQRYGDIKYANHKYVYPDEIGDDDQRPPSWAKDGIEKAADAFRPDADYLLIIGDHLQLVALSAALAIRYGRFRVLRYVPAEKAYIPVLIDVVTPVPNLQPQAEA